MANYQHFDNRGGVLRWKERNDSLVNLGEPFVCYSLHPTEINLDLVDGEVEIISFDEYKRECPELRYSGD